MSPSWLMKPVKERSELEFEDNVLLWQPVNHKAAIDK